jgi:hypothetical protein
VADFIRERVVRSLVQGRLSSGHSVPGASDLKTGVSPLGVFEFIIVLVLISTFGKVLTDRRQPKELGGDAAPRLARGEAEDLREMVHNLSGRLERLEEERDFYKDLLEPPEKPRVIGGPGE